MIGWRRPGPGAGWRPRSPWPAVRAAASAVVLLSLGLLAWSFADFLARIEAGEAAPARHAEGAVALTGGADRVADAIELLAKGSADRLLITGVNPLTSRDELARLVPAARTLFRCCIELGYEAANTTGNAAETERWVRAHHIRSLIVVTSNYHMPRALAEIGWALPDVDLIAYPVVSDWAKRPWWTDMQSTRLIVFEYCKYAATRLRLHFAPPKQGGTEEAAN